MFDKSKCSVIFLILFMKIRLIIGFNLSPVPNLVLREPEIGQTKSNESSYFGFTLNFRGENIMIGAPRANSILYPELQFNQPGAIYKCSLKNGNCSPFLLQLTDNISNKSLHTENRDFQWLGASLHGGSKETDSFIVCAPRYIWEYSRKQNNISMNGVCYWVPNTIDNSTSIIRKIAPLTDPQKQVYRPYYPVVRFIYIFGEQGISSHISEYNDDILIGAPGVNSWRGALVYIAYNQSTKFETVFDFHGKSNSYFGYSVTSGIFEGKDSKKVMHVVSAPQANQQQGEVYIMDIIKGEHGSKMYSVIAPLHGTQLGEYFGYCVLAEDFNGDGFTDLAISAPFYKTGSSFDNGAVYIFMNKGNLNFELGRILTSGTSSPSRFGTAITKLRDLDHDGFNDIAIGAPFTDDAGVHIYLGGPNGLSNKPSQILKNPDEKGTANDMFGHGLSQGADIDENLYIDLAVGAPNRDKVYLYKSYPVVKIIGSVKATTREIRTDNTTFIIQVCWKLHYNVESGNRNDQNINITLKVDPTYKRVTFENGIYRNEFVALITEKQNCTEHTINVKAHAQANSKPIDIEMAYNLISKISDKKGFQDDAVITNPSDVNVSRDQIVVATACTNEICLADLIINSSIQNNFTIGSSNTLAVHYTIRNNGEDIAYLPKLELRTSSEIPFGKLSPLCMMDQNMLNCDLTDDNKMIAGQEKNWTILLDMTNYSGKGFNISAAVSSAGDESYYPDNEIRNFVDVKEFSEISYSQKNVQLLVYPTTLKTTKVVNKFEIRNNGPSNVKNMTVQISIPTSYFDPVSSSSIKFMDFGNLEVVATHNKRNLNLKIFQNNETLQRKIQEDNDNVGLTSFSEENNSNSRNKRDAESAINKEDSLALQGEIPFNKAITLNCSDVVERNCIFVEFIVYNLQPGNNAIEIMLQYELNLEQIDMILDSEKEFCVISTMLDISREGDENKETLQPNETVSHFIISREPTPVPIWIYIISIMAGLLVLILVTYGMHKVGFFRRKKKEQLKKLIRESQRVVPRKYEMEQNDVVQQQEPHLD